MNVQDQSVLLATGLPEFDAAIGGGFRPGELALGVALTGTGKTVLATQLAVTFALRGQHGIFVRTSGGISDLTERVSLHLHHRVEELFPGNSAIAANSYKHFMHVIQENVVFFDWAAGNLSIFGDLEQQVDREAEKQKRRPQWLIFDEVHRALGTVAFEVGAMSRALMASARKLSKLATKYGMACIGFTDANPTRAANLREVDYSCIAECTTMHELATVIFGISSLCPDSMQVGDPAYLRDQYFHISKGGIQGRISVPVDRDCKRVRFMCRIEPGS